MLVLITILLWAILGCFICHKANWYDNEDSVGAVAGCIFTILLAPAVFAWDVFNRTFIQPWD